MEGGRFSLYSDDWERFPAIEDDEWLDVEIREEQDYEMKSILMRVKSTMKLLSNEKKRNYIFEERKRRVEWMQYTADFQKTEGFEVGDYPYLCRDLYGSFVTRYYYPPEITITDFELDKLTGFANKAIDHYNITETKEYSNVTVIMAMRAFSCGLWYYLTFQASLPNHPPQIFEAKLYEEPPWVHPPLAIKFVRLKVPRPT